MKDLYDFIVENNKMIKILIIVKNCINKIEYIFIIKEVNCIKKEGKRNDKFYKYSELSDFIEYYYFNNLV